MKEIVLQHYLEGHASIRELAADTVGAFDRRVDGAGAVFSQLHVTPMAHEFTVTSSHVLKLLDAVLAGELSLDALDAICFCLEGSDCFGWDADTEDGERVAEALFLLGSPEVNYPLTQSVLGKVRHYLVTGEETFTREDLRPSGKRPHLLSINRLDRKPDV